MPSALLDEALPDSRVYKIKRLSAKKSPELRPNNVEEQIITCRRQTPSTARASHRRERARENARENEQTVDLALSGSRPQRYTLLSSSDDDYMAHVPRVKAVHRHTEQ